MTNACDTSNLELVRRFVAAMGRNRKQEILAFFDEESEFLNVPMGTATGRDAIWAVLGPLHERAEAVEYVLHNVAETERGVVLTERTDRYKMGDRWAEFPVMGAFEIDGGVIRHWRDYFDMKQCLDQLPELFAANG